MKITQAALNHRTTVYVLILFIIVVGINSYRSLPLEAAPDIEIPILLISTVYPGVSPADMETLVTNILERELKDLKNVKEMTSTSSESVSVIKIEFDTDVDMDDAYQKVRDKVDKASPELPPEAEDPVLTEINISEFPIMLINIFGDHSLVRLKKIGEELEDKIERIPGVLNVDVTGGLEREIHIYLNPERMEYYKVGVGKVINRIQQEHINTPGGNLDLGDTKYLVRVPGEYKDVSLMEEIVLKAPGGNPIKLGDIGRVLDGYKERESISRVNRKECVTLRVQKRAGEDGVLIADEIHALLEETKLPGGMEYLIRQDHSEFIRDMVSDLENSIISGLILVLGVLLFVMGIRNSTFVAIAIPMSMLITFIILRMSGVTLNMVVLFSLILALGMLVDNSIVVVENIFRHVTEGMPRTQASLVATTEVAWPIITSTATTVVAFAPLLFWPGIMGTFMGFLPRTVICALLASLFIALVINPVIAASFLKKTGRKLFDDSGEVRGLVMGWYSRALAWSLDHPKIVLGFGFISLVGVIATYGALGAGVEFFPGTTPERAQVLVKAPQGTVIEKTDGMAREVEDESLGEENLEDLVVNVGFGGGNVLFGGGGGSSHSAVADLEFKDRSEATGSTWDTIKSIREKLAKLPGAEYRLELEKMGPPTGASVAVEISGPDYEVLNRFARMVKERIAKVPGVVEIKDDYDAGKPEIKVVVDRERAMLRKVNTMSISHAIRTAINGTKAAVLREGDEEYDIIVRFDEQFRQSIEDVLDIRITGKDDVQVALRDVAEVRTTGGLGSIKHIDQTRSILVSSDVMGRSSSEVLADIRKLIDEKSLGMPLGYRLHFGGESEEQDQASAFLGEAFSMGLLLMALILITQFNSVLRPLIILASVLLSLMGVFLGLLVCQGKFGIMMTGMGIISLAGVVVNNAIVLIDYINQCREKGGLGLKEALLKAGLVRYRPVMLTAITTILGMLPMALGISIDFRSLTIDMGSSSTEWWGPMARAVSFGLFFATIATLVMVPVMYLLQEQLTGWLTARLRSLGSLFGSGRNLPADEEGV